MIELIPHIQQYSGLWSIEPNAAERTRQVIASIQWESHIREAQSRVDEGDHRWSSAGYEVTADGVAIIDLEGVLTKYGSSLSMGGSTVRLRKSLRNAREDAAVKSILLCIESPGGSTMGTPDAAAEVAATAKVKPVTCFFEDIGCSAAYWIGSQATRVVANADAIVGSIGTYFAIDDVSKAFSEAGIKTHLFTTGPHKGAGTYGTELTKEQIAEYQSLVDRMNAPFVAAVAAARKLSGDDLAAVTDGRVWRGDEAVAVGLIDAVMTYEDALAELSSTANPEGDSTMSTAKPKASDVRTTAKSAAIAAKAEDTEKETDSVEEEEEEEEVETKKAARKSTKAKKSQEEEEEDEAESAASVAQLKAALPNASADFIVSALEQGLSVAQARMTWLEQTVESQAKTIETLKAQGSRPGVAKPLGSASAAKSFDGADPKAAWEAEVKSKVDAGMPRPRAVSQVVAEQPELHQAYLAAVNSR